MRKTIAGIIAFLSLCTGLRAQQTLQMAGAQGNIGGSITTLNQQGIVNGQGAGRDRTKRYGGLPQRRDPATQARRRDRRGVGQSPRYHEGHR